MNKGTISLSKCLKDLSNSELKIYLHILERGGEAFPHKFEVNLMELCRDCDISMPTAKSALDRLVSKGNLLFIGRAYKTAPGQYALPGKEPKPIVSPKTKTPEEVAKSAGIEEAKLVPKMAYIKDIVFQNVLVLFKDEYLPQARAIYKRPLSQEDLKDFYMEHVWKNRDDEFTTADTLKFLSDVQSGVPIAEIVKQHLES